jgi:hypothetical protein
MTWLLREMIYRRIMPVCTLWLGLVDAVEREIAQRGERGFNLSLVTAPLWQSSRLLDLERCRRRGRVPGTTEVEMWGLVAMGVRVLG